MHHKKIFTYFVRSGSVLSLSASAITVATSIILGFQIDFKLPAIAYLLTLSSYYINRRAEIEQDRISHPDRTKFIEKNAAMGGLAILAMAIALYLSYAVNLETFLIALIAPVSVILYSIKVHAKVKRLKDVSWIKTAFVSLIWTANVFLTYAYYRHPITEEAFVLAAFVFIRIFIDCVIFDIRDIIADRLYNVRTIPIILNEKGAIQLIHALNIIAGLIIFVSTMLGLMPFFANALNFITLYGFFYINWSQNPKIDKHFLCDVIVDGEYVLWPVVLILVKLIFKLF